METTHDIRVRSAAIELPTQEEVSGEEKQTTPATDEVLKSLSPLINSMRAFGLYFSRQPRVSTATSNQQNCQNLRKCHGCWNPGRIYATVMLVVTYINAFRHFILFDGDVTLGVELLLKLCLLASVLLIVLLHTAYYVASHTGSLDRVFRRVDLSTADISPKYNRRAKVAALVCCTLTISNTILYIYPVISSGQFGDISMTVFFDSPRVSKPYADIINAAFIIADFQSTACYLFPQATNYVVVSLLCDQFAKLNEEFGKCIGGRGEFHGNFEQFRRRHQAISHSVKEADRFLKISNVACFCCHMIGIIVIVFCSVFYPRYTLTRGADVAFQYFYWLLINLLGLSLAAGMAISVNNKANKLAERIHDIDFDTLNGKAVSKINVFLNRLNGEPIGVSVLGIFVIDKNTILAILALLITYFLLVVQFVNPSSSSSYSPTSAPPTNHTFTTTL